ncbi:bifunctional cytidylyltransferase/SDR family oxidoreductase [Agromyces intestinalis]|uniref:2-C-methyl-D-erythritol 4-phosphate cytidylyltransferase n=1 Tax=Agromyces intestinalis TaxID=2592652 RepID=A0A5C1YC09_9MICO|nr:bifunctional cytidylyltransferase/SDR family oxidoreductase [Agromyces intestinalis]QEO13526.1 bifunctional cytidylyltransferase/SDR family oxidoreductase [Agromyces intestinalis]
MSSPSTSPRTIAVILAGGVGSRVGLGLPKQLIKIAGKAIVEHTLERFEASEQLDEVLVMMNAETVHELDYLRGDERFAKLIGILPGGGTRNDTTKLAIAALAERGATDDTKVLFHDAVRPFVDDRILDDCIAALDEYDAVDTAIPSADTIIEVDDASVITGIPPRSTLRRGQTPQGFRLGTIRRAYEIAAGDPEFAATDDCGVVFSYLPEVPIKVVAGSAQNMKITEPLDIHIADKIFQLQSESLSTSTAGLPDLRSRSVVVLGGSYGIGAAIADLARAAGARTHVYSRSLTGTDVTSRKLVRRALSDAAEHGPIDYVVLTAGVLSISHLVRTPKSQLRHTLDVNLLAPAKVAQEAYEYLRESRGQLLLFTSSSYTRGRAGYSVYSATKAGVVNFTQALADEWSADGIRVNCVNPQRTRTPMRTSAFGDEPAESLLEPEAVAAASLRVLTADFTGQIVDVRVEAQRSAAPPRT